MLKVKVPATSANLGPGFDNVGMALKLYNEFYFVEKRNALIPNEAKMLGKNSLCHQAINNLSKITSVRAPEMEIYIKPNIPKARGLGSSATLTVAGLAAGNELLDTKISIDELLSIATDLEGHPDNVVPAFLGGLAICILSGGKIRYLKFMPKEHLKVVVAVPDFELKTSMSRKVLPEEVRHRDAAQNTGRFGLFVAAILTGKYEHLSFAMEDLLHQPYRMQLVPGMKNVMDAALRSGAHGSCLSGAGPAILALCSKDAEIVGDSMKVAWDIFGLKSKIYILDIEKNGVCVSPESP